MKRVIERLLNQYRTMNRTLRSVMVFLIAAAMFLGTLNLMASPASALSNTDEEELSELLEEDSGYKTEEESEDEEQDIVTEGTPSEEEPVVSEGTTEEEPEISEEPEEAVVSEGTTEEEPVVNEEPEEETEEPAEELAVYTLTGNANRVDVTVEYEEGAFPEGITMEVKTVGNRSVIEAINNTVNQEENKAVVRVQAVDIIFRDSDGTEVEPAKPVKVTMKSNSVPQKAEEKPVIVHVDDQDGPKVVETSPEETKKEEVKFEAGSFSVYAIVYTLETVYTSYDGNTYKITVGYTAEANLPEDAALSVSELLPENAGYGDYLLASKAALELEGTEVNARVFDISIVNGEGTKVEPKAKVQVEIRLADPDGNENKNFGVVHFGDKTEVLETETAKEGDAQVITFETNSFSIYVPVELPDSDPAEKDPLDLNDKSYAIVTPINPNNYNAPVAVMAETGKYGDGGQPEHDILTASQAMTSLNQATNVYGNADANVTRWTFKYVKTEGGDNYYNISATADGKTVYINMDTDTTWEAWTEAGKPQNYSCPLTIGDKPQDLIVRKFGEGNAARYTVSVLKDGRYFDINQDYNNANQGFVGNNGNWDSSRMRLCTYNPNQEDVGMAIVSFNPDGNLNKYAMSNVRDGTRLDGTAVTLGNDYVTYTTGNPVLWYFIPQADGKYKIKDANGNYLKLPNNGADTQDIQLTTNVNEASNFDRKHVNNLPYLYELSVTAGGKTYRINRTGDNNFCFWSGWNDDDCVYLAVPAGQSLNLDGFEGAIISGNRQVALTAQDGAVGTSDPVVVDFDNHTYPADDSITTWKFTKNGNGYRISAGGKYLKFNGDNQAMTLVDEAAADTFQVFQLANGGVAIGGVVIDGNTYYLSQWLGQPIYTQNHGLLDAANIFDGDSCNTFLLCTPRDVETEEVGVFNPFGYDYKNTEVAPNDVTNDKNGQRVGTAINGNNGETHLNGAMGDLAYEWTKDDKKSIKYIYSQDEADEITVTPLGNGQYTLTRIDGAYLQYLHISETGAHLDSTIKDYYKYIDDWKLDITPVEGTEDRYTISKTINGTTYYLTLDSPASAEDPNVHIKDDLQFFVTDERMTGDDARWQEFVFAKKDKFPEPEHEKIKTVPTVDSERNGIKIHMFDYEFAQMKTNVITAGDWINGPATPGIMEKLLYSRDDDSKLVPDAKEGKPVPTNGINVDAVASLFSTDSTTYYRGEGNHLFLQSVYDETEYYHYRSWENYAYWGGHDFTVYDAVGIPSENHITAAFSHGNYLPYNPLVNEEGYPRDPYSTRNYNMFDAEGKQLDETDPHFGESLIAVQNPNYYFGMVMDVEKYYMPKNGLVGGKDPMTFEFNGDDDMWVYSDGVLLLDIGGIHDPRSGSINYQTGEIIQQDGGKTTIRARYEEAYADAVAKGKMTQAEADNLMDEYFGPAGSRKDTFANYSEHSLKMFYLERGDGASNLDIRFNLITIPPGQFTIEKKLEEANGKEIFDDSKEFQFRAYGKEKYTADYKLVTGTKIGTKTKRDGTTEEITIGEDGIFKLKPGEKIKLDVKHDEVEYYIEEVNVPAGINSVKINGVDTPISDGTATSTRAKVEDRNYITVENIKKPEPPDEEAPTQIIFIPNTSDTFTPLRYMISGFVSLVLLAMSAVVLYRTRREH